MLYNLERKDRFAIAISKSAEGGYLLDRIVPKSNVGC